MSNSNPRRGGILSGLLLTGLAVIVLTCVAGLYIARNVRISSAHRNGVGDFSIEIPGGQFKLRARENVDPASVGVPVYPGATRMKDGGSATLQWTSDDGNEDKGFSVIGAEMLTQDSAAQVIDYYRTQLPNLIVVTERDGATRLEYKEGGYKRIIAIREKHDGTHIGVASIGKPGSN